MTWMVLAFALQLGFTPNDEFIQYNPPDAIGNTIASLQGEQLLLINMDAEVRLFDKHIYIGGNLGVPTWMVSTGGWPVELQSVVRAGVRFGGFEFGWSHLCTHPVMPFQPLVEEQVNWEGGYDEFHIKFSGEAKIF